ncbi:MAG: hypothetical protein WKF47_06370 [Geodermatophilaceae bacterium]
MVTQRTEGLYRLFLLCQIIMVAALFWFGVWIMVTFYSEGAELTWRRYSIYCALLVLGMTVESLSRDGSKNYFLQNELLRQHRLSLRQTFASVGALVFYLDRDEGRLHLASLLLQLRAVALCGAALLASLSAVAPRPRHLQRRARRKDTARSAPATKQRNSAAGCAENPRSDCARSACISDEAIEQTG